MEGQFVRQRRLAAVLAGLLILTALYVVSRHSYLLFHSLAELFSIVVACSVFVIAWNARHYLDNAYLLFIGIAFVFVGTVDTLHTLAYRGMGVFTGTAADLATQLWIAARYMQSIALLIAPTLLGGRIKPGRVFAGFSAVTALLLLAIFQWKIFPVCFEPGVRLTPFKKASEYIISLILAASIALLLQKRRYFDRGVLRLLVGSIGAAILSELAFTFYIGVYDFSNLVGHFFKIISFTLTYKAIIETGLVKPFNLLFRDLKLSEEALREANEQLEGKVRERTAELSAANAALASEIAERRQAEAALRRSELKYRELVEHANSMILRVDARGRILFFNEFAQNFFGFREDEIIGAQAMGTIVPETESSGRDLAALVRNILADPERHPSDEHENTRKNGERVWVAWTYKAILDTDGRVAEIMCIGNDITARRRVEEELERSNRELQEFAFIASHDLHEPLRKVMAFGDRLNSRYGDRLGEDGRDYLQRMRKAAFRMQTLIESLLSYSRVTTKAETYSAVDLNVLMKEILGDLETSIADNGVRIEVERLPVVDADSNQMRQLFQNLIANALKYHGTEAPFVRILGRKADPITGRTGSGISEGYQILVEDNGIGFDEKYLDRIFTPFQRLHGRDAYEGTGMGLAICRKIMDRHGGSLTARSTPGKGSTFIVTLPSRSVLPSS
jgi:PAS domain S-box-containing protein